MTMPVTPSRQSILSFIQHVRLKQKYLLSLKQDSFELAKRMIDQSREKRNNLPPMKSIYLRAEGREMTSPLFSRS